MGRRSKILICAFAVLAWVLPAAAQVEFEGITMSMGGNIGVGYNGDLNEQGGSDHGLDFNGSGTLAGSFYNPNFLSFSAQPYYNRSQASSGSGSIFDASGYNGNVNIFTGSHFPGSISFGQNFDSTGVYGIPGVAGLTTKNSERSFGIGWAAEVPGFPSLSVGYGHGSGTSSLLGSAAESDNSTNFFTVHTGYRLAGFSLGAGFTHQTVDTNSSNVLGSNEGLIANTSSNSYQFTATRTLHNGGFSFGFTRSDYSDSYSDGTTGTSSGSTDNAYATYGTKVWKLPLTTSIAYTDNLYGSFEEQLISGGGTALQTSLSPESRSLIMNASTGYNILPHIFLSGFVSRQEEYIGGSSFGLTQIGANLSGNLGERFKGLTATLGVVDSANQQGNEGASAVANVNYHHNFGTWEFEGNFGYYQAVQTLLAIYQTSSLNYGASIRHRFPKGIMWSLGGGGGRSGFEQVKGNGNVAESVTSSLSTHWFSLGGTYSKSYGTAVVTASGLVPVPMPIISNNTVLFNGIGEGATFSTSPARGLSWSASYSTSHSNTINQATNVTSINKTEMLNSYLTYSFRKVYFNAGVVQFHQDLSAAGAPPSVVTSYYFGISRWFKAF